METLKANPRAASSEADAQTEIQSLIARARSAQAAIESYSQEEADGLATSVGWQVYKSREALAKLAVEEGGFGNVPDKVTKIALRVLGTLADMASIKTCGVIEEDAARGLIKIAKPVGVIAALIPTTGPDATPPVKALAAVKARNAIIVAPHPRTARTTAAAVEIMRKGCEKAGAPADLIQVIEQPSIAKTALLMRMSDLIVATGGASMVKAAYSSGTPAYGVGVGNAVHVVDETADLDDAAEMIARAKTFDYATSCLADNSVVAHSSIYSGLRQRLARLGGHVCTPEEKLRLKAVMWPEGQHIPSIDIVAKPASRIAELAGITLAPGCSFIIVEEDGVGEAHLFSGEKLSVVLALYRYDGGIEAAIGLVNRITSYQGAGHTCGIHTRREEH
ncbi:MAG TPA: aldehyde dehydrogenase family protein, partial [Methylocella sp.]|nr:aldehyde dehydrogenase family protein [Methylocella sp.]